MPSKQESVMFSKPEQLPPLARAGYKVFIEQEPGYLKRKILKILNQTRVFYWEEVPHTEDGWLKLLVIGADTANPGNPYEPLDMLAYYRWEIRCGYKNNEEILAINYTKLKPPFKIYPNGTVALDRLSVYKFSDQFGIKPDTPRVLFKPGFSRSGNYQVDQVLLIVAPHLFRETITEQVGAPTIWPLQAAIDITAGH